MGGAGEAEVNDGVGVFVLRILLRDMFPLVDACTHIKSGSVCTETYKEKALFRNMTMRCSNNYGTSGNISD